MRKAKQHIAVENVTRKKAPQAKVDQTMPMQLYRISQNIAVWRDAVNQAESVSNPNRTELIRNYNDIVLDPHLTALMQSRKNKVLSKEWNFYDGKGEEIEELESLVKQPWFIKSLEYAFDSIFYGYSLIQYGDVVNDTFQSCELVPREYVSPEGQKVKPTPNSAWNDGKPFTERPYSDWCLFVGDKKDLGLLCKASPLVIYKKFVTANWSEYAEMFGMPMRIGKTDINDPTSFSNMKKAVHTIGSNASAVISMEDIIQFVEVSKADAYQVYDKFIERMNSELSKLIIGQTGTTDMGKNRGSDDVHENVADEYGYRDQWFLEAFINTKFIPFLQNLGFDIPKGARCKVEEEDEFETAELAKFATDLLKYGTIEEDFILKKFGIPFKQFAPQVPNGGSGAKKLSIDDKVSNMYSQLHSCSICNAEGEQSEGETLFEGLFSSQDFEDVIQAIFYKLISTSKPPINLYKAYGVTFEKGINKGVEFAIEFGKPDPLMLEALKDNSWNFSAAKTWQFTKDMEAQIVDEFGNQRTFKQFREAVDGIGETYNKTWLRTEYELSVSNAQNASQWDSFERDKKVLPFLKYQTVGDARVRDSHKRLDGIIRRVDDKFWNSYAPANGYNCRCLLIQLGDAKESDVSGLDFTEKEVPNAFRFNPAKKKRIYPKDHPYYEVSTKYRDDKNNNFNLPIRP